MCYLQKGCVPGQVNGNYSVEGDRRGDQFHRKRLRPKVGVSRMGIPLLRRGILLYMISPAPAATAPSLAIDLAVGVVGSLSIVVKAPDSPFFGMTYPIVTWVVKV